MSVCAFALTILQHLHCFHVHRTGMKIDRIYRKNAGVIAVAVSVTPLIIIIIIIVILLLFIFWYLQRFYLQTSRDVKHLKSTKVWFLFLMTSRWFAVRLDSICSIFITISTFGCLLLRDGL
ncbi:hypothetical protein PAMP_016370 [Pampus punctatissimus]